MSQSHVLISMLIAFLSFSIGLFLAIKPALAIEAQRRFYLMINWRVEPVSMQKELRNTRIIGIFLVVTAIIWSVYILITIS